MVSRWWNKFNTKKYWGSSVEISGGTGQDWKGLSSLWGLHSSVFSSSSRSLLLAIYQEDSVLCSMGFVVWARDESWAIKRVNH